MNSNKRNGMSTAASKQALAYMAAFDLANALDETAIVLYHVTDDLAMLSGPAYPPLPTHCVDCGKPFTLIQGCFAFEGRCPACYDAVHGPQCHVCHSPTDYQFNGLPTCPGCMAEVSGANKEEEQ
ncbi:MAG: hypothetical protein WC455_17205 [Dehalococcoidia bacterium]|jgi:hypothetical protein